MQWAAHMVNEAKDRSKTLIQGVMRPPNTDPRQIGSGDDIEAITKDLEAWTRSSKDATHCNAGEPEGLNVPRWRETKELKHETVLESMNLTS